MRSLPSQTRSPRTSPSDYGVRPACGTRPRSVLARAKTPLPRRRAYGRVCPAWRSRRASKSVNMGGLFVVDAHQRSGEPCDLRLLRDDQGHRLAAEANLVVIEWAEMRALGGYLVLVLRVRRGELRPVLVREHVEHALDRLRVRGRDALNPPWRSWMRHEAVSEARHVVLRSILGGASDLDAPIDAGGRLSERARPGDAPSGRAHRRHFFGLRLRRTARRLIQRTHDGAPRQLDLEVVVAVAARRAAAGQPRA